MDGEDSSWNIGVYLTTDCTCSYYHADFCRTHSRQTVSAYDAGSVLVISDTAVAGSDASAQSVPFFGQVAGLVAAKTTGLGTSTGQKAFGPNTVGAAEASTKVPGYGWKDAKWWKTVERLKTGESIQVKNLRIAAELRKDAFSNYTRSRYRGPLKDMPQLEGTYDWHIHGGEHSTPHIQVKTTDGTWVRIEVGK